MTRSKPCIYRMNDSCCLSLGLCLVCLCINCGEISADDDLQTKVQELSQAIGYAPRLEDFVRMIDDLPVPPVDPTELPKAWNALRALQNPPITLDEFCRLRGAAQSAIASYECEVRCENNIPRNPILPDVANYRFACADGKYLMKRQVTSDPDGPEYFVEWFDGKSYRQYLHYTNKTRDHASTKTLESLESFFPRREHPLCASMLLDSSALLGQEVLEIDMALLLRGSKSIIIFELLEDVDEFPCLVVCNSVMKACFDLPNGCAMRKLEEYTFHFDPDSQRTVRQLQHRRSFRSIREHGSGIFLPDSIAYETFEGGAVKERYVLSVEWKSVNKPLPPSSLVEEIPRGTRIMDVANRVTYREGVSTTVESVLNEAAISKRRVRYTWYIVVLNVAALLGLIAFVYKARARR